MNIAIAIVAKAPIPGLAKTRLARVVGNDAAAEMAAHLLRHTLSEAKRSGLTVTLHGTPADNTLLSEISIQTGLNLSNQVDGDLGSRLASVVTQELKTHDGVLVMGSDCPDLTAERLLAAAAALKDHDAVFYPALDGGYTLIGLRQMAVELFSDMPWSTDEVMPETLRRLQRLGWRVWQGPALADIDRYEDFEYLPPHWPRPKALNEAWS